MILDKPLSETMEFIHTSQHDHEHTFTYLIRVKVKRTSFWAILMVAILLSIILIYQIDLLDSHIVIQLVMDNHISVKTDFRELVILFSYLRVMLQYTTMMVFPDPLPKSNASPFVHVFFLCNEPPWVSCQSPVAFLPCPTNTPMTPRTWIMKGKIQEKIGQP